MFALLLAAGSGNRLQSILNGKPKPLLKVFGVTLLEHQINYLFKIGINDLTIITKPSYGLDIANIAKRFPIIHRIIKANTKSGFESFSSAENILKGKKFVLSVIDSIFEFSDIQKFKSEVLKASIENNFLVGVTNYIHDKKPSYVILDNEKVINIGRNCGTSSFVTAGIYHCPSDFFDYVYIAKNSNINSMSEYLGYYASKIKLGVPFLFSMMIDIDTPEDLLLAEKILSTA